MTFFIIDKEKVEVKKVSLEFLSLFFFSALGNHAGTTGASWHLTRPDERKSIKMINSLDCVPADGVSEDLE